MSGSGAAPFLQHSQPGSCLSSAFSARPFATPQGHRDTALGLGTLCAVPPPQPDRPTQPLAANALQKHLPWNTGG